MLALTSFFFVLSILVLVHELGHLLVARRFGVKVEKFSFGFGPKVLSWKRGETEYLISAIPIGGYVKMAGDEPGEAIKGEKWEFLSRPPSERFRIIFAGPLLNYLLAFFIFSIIFIFGSPTLTTEVGSILKGYPAEAGGLKVGDRIVALDSKPVKFWEDVTEVIHKRTEGSLKLSIEREGRTFNIEIKPIVREMKDIFGKKTKVALIGIAPSQEIEKVRYGILTSFKMGFKKLMQLTLITYKAIFAILTGRLSLRESMTGPIGIFVITGKAASLGLIYVLHLMGVLSASLAIFNLLPFPVLDGGHIIFLAIEKVRRRPLSARAQGLITNFGISLLVFLTLIVFYNDVVNYQVLEKLGGFFRR